MRALLCAMLGASAAAHAATYYFSYTFADGQQVTGSFTGVSSNGGQSVTNIGNLSVALNGIAFAPVNVSGVTYGNPTLQINAWNPALMAFDDTTPVTIYANGALNNFAISDVDAATDSNPDYEFAYVNDATNNDLQALAVNFLQSDSFSTAAGNPNQLALDLPGVAASWQLSDTPPGPTSDGPLPLWAFAALGALLLGLASRRQRA